MLVFKALASHWCTEALRFESLSGVSSWSKASAPSHSLFSDLVLMLGGSILRVACTANFSKRAFSSVFLVYIYKNY